MCCDRMVTKPLPFTPLDWSCPTECTGPVLGVTGGKFPSAQGTTAVDCGAGLIGKATEKDSQETAIFAFGIGENSNGSSA